MTRSAPKVAVAIAVVLSLAAARVPVAAGASPTDEPFTDFADLDLDDLLGGIVTASKHEQTLAETPAAVTVFGAKDIERFGWTTLADLLREVPGLYVSYDRVYSYLGVRGFSRPGDFNSRVLVLLDGHPMQEGWYGSAGIGQEGGFDLTGVRRVEVVRGPGSVLYGTSAFFATINVVMMEAEYIDRYGIETGAGSFGALLARGRAARLFGGNGEIVAIGSLARTNGRDDLRFPGLAGVEDASLSSETDYLRAGSGFAKYTKGPLVLRAAYGKREKGMPTAPYGGIFGDPKNRADDGHGFFEAAYDRQVSRAVDVTVGGSVDRSSYDDFIPISLGEGEADDLFRDVARTNWENATISVRVHAPERSLTTIGAEFQARQFDLDVFTERGSSAPVRDRRDQRNGVLYAQNEIRLVGPLRGTVGARLESHSDFGTVTVPRVGLVTPLGAGFRAKFLYGEAFRNPSIAEAFYDDGTSIASNPDLRRECATTREVIVERGFARTQVIGVSVYATTVRDLIDFVTTVIPEFVDDEAGDTGERLQPQNLAKVEARGAELRYEGSFSGGSRLFGGVSYSHAREISADVEARIANSPEWVGSFGIARPFLRERLTAAVSGEVVGDRRTFREVSETVASHAIANLNLRYRFDSGLHVNLLVRNFGDSRFADPIGEEHVPDRMHQDGRSAELRVGYGF